MRSLAGVGARSLAHRKGRSALTAVGILLGVAILFGVLVSNASLDRAFTEIISGWKRPWQDVLARPAGAWGGKADPVVADRARALPDVQSALATTTYLAPLPNVQPEGDAEAAFLNIEGSDMAVWQRHTRGLVPMAEGRMPATLNEITISTSLPREWDIQVGEDVVVTAKSGEPRTLRVVGRFGAQRGDPDTTYGAFATADTVWSIGGDPGRIDAVVIDLRDGVESWRWIAEHKEALGTGIELEEMGGDNEGFGEVMEVIQSSLTFVACLALFVGAFLIYLTLSMAVVERTRLYGTLRALGARRRQVRRIVLIEAGVLGVVSTLAGMVVGLGMSVVLVRTLSSLLDQRTPPLTIPPSAVVVATAAGLLTTLASALIPARRAARLAPVAAMRGDHGADARLGRTWVLGLALAVAGTAYGLAAQGVSAMSTSTFLTLLGVVLLTPAMLRPLARVLGRVTRRAEAGVGDVAVMHLVKERSRSAYTLALVMVVFAMVFSMAAANRSMARALDRVIDTQFGSDLRLWSPTGFEGPLAAAVRDHPDVAVTSEVRFGTATVEAPRRSTGSAQRSARPQLVMIDPATYFEVAGFSWAQGDDATTKAAFARGGAVVLSASTARRLGVEHGGTVQMLTSRGRKPFRVVGLYAGFGSPQPAFIGVGDGVALFNASRANGLAANLRPGADPDRVRDSLRSQPAVKRSGVFIETVGAAKAEARAELGGFFRVFYGVLLVAGVVGMLGLTNTLAMSVLTRVREIGILRAIGTRRRQVRSMVAVEAATLVLVALLLGLPLGIVLSQLFLRSATDALGYSASYAFPWPWVPGLAVLALLIGGVAALAPARRASRLQVVAALAYE